MNTGTAQLWIVEDTGDQAWAGVMAERAREAGLCAAIVPMLDVVLHARHGDVVVLHAGFFDPLASAARLASLLPACPMILSGALSGDDRAAASEAGIAVLVEDTPNGETLAAAVTLACRPSVSTTPALLRTMCTTMSSLAGHAPDAQRERTLRRAVDEIGALFSAPIVALYLFEGDAPTAQLRVAIATPDAASASAALEQHHDAVERAARQGTVTPAPHGDDARVSAVLCVPIPSPTSERPRGALLVQKTRRRAFFSRRDVDMATAIASVIEGALAATDAREHAAHIDLRIRAAGRLSTIGEAAAGIADEVLSPIRSLRVRVNDVISMVANLGPALRELEEEDPSLRATLDDLPALLCETWEGITRADSVFDSMQAIARPAPDARHEATSVASIVAAALRLLRSRLRTEVACEIDPSLWVRGSLGELCLALVNLIANAADACDDRARAAGDGERYQPRIVVSTSTANGRACVRVEDNGTGISREQIERIFLPLFTTKEAHGTGLGLSLVRRIAEGHDGLVRVDSTPGAGTAFVLELPLAPALDGARDVGEPFPVTAH
jgi:signal transduction histidine kinase